MSPDGASVYVAASDADAIVRFDRDPATGDLTPMGCVEDNDTGASGCAQSTDGLDRAAAVAVSPDGSTVYVAGTDDDAIVRLRRNTDTGRLTPKDCVDDDQVGQGVDDCAQSTSGLNGAIAVAVSADGESVYATGGNDSTIVRFRRGAASGTLTPKGCIDDVGGNDCGIETTDGLGGAFSVAVSPDGESVYVASLTDDAVVRFDRNTNNGKLTPRGCVNDVAGEAGCPTKRPASISPVRSPSAQTGPPSTSPPASTTRSPVRPRPGGRSADAEELCRGRRLRAGRVREEHRGARRCQLGGREP